MLEVLGIIFLVILVIWFAPFILGCGLVLGALAAIGLFVFAIVNSGQAPQPVAPAPIVYHASPTSLLGQYRADHPELSGYSDQVVAHGLFDYGMGRDKETFSDFAARIGVRCVPAPCR